MSSFRILLIVGVVLNALLLALVFGTADIRFSGHAVPDKVNAIPEPAYGRIRLSEALLEAEANPCESPLQLTKLFGSWYLTCEGCAAIPVTPGKELPKIVFDTAEKWITNHRVSVSFVLREMGDCD